MVEASSSARTWCARCGEVPAVEVWRNKLAVCSICWCVLEEWALGLEQSIRQRVEHNEWVRAAIRRYIDTQMQKAR